MCEAWKPTTHHISVPLVRLQKRRILPLQNELEIREQVLKDVHALCEKKCQLSPGWLRQLGLNDRADAMEVLLSNPTMMNRRRAREDDLYPTYEVDCILEERKSTGRAVAWFLVRWAGYRPEWEAWRISGEIGDPIETWEPKSVIQATEAYQVWREAQHHNHEDEVAPDRGRSARM